MSDWRVIAAILVLGCACYAMRAGGFLLAGFVSERGQIARLLRLAPGNLFVAFVTAGCMSGGWPSVVAALAGLAVMAVSKREWAALAAGFAAAAAVLALHAR